MNDFSLGLWYDYISERNRGGNACDNGTIAARTVFVQHSDREPMMLVMLRDSIVRSVYRAPFADKGTYSNLSFFPKVIPCLVSERYTSLT